MKQYQQLRGAIVGFGSIGRRHAENLKKLGVECLVVVRRPSGRNPAFTPPEGACIVASHAEAIAEGLDFAVICNPTRFHVDSALPYLAAGIPILMEKPISDRCEDARQLAEEASRRGLPACMAYCMRYHPAYAAAREAVRAGTIGRVLYAKAWFESYLPAWHPWEDYRQSYAARKDLGGGALRTLDHEIDFLNWCLGTPQAVVGSSRRSGARRRCRRPRVPTHPLSGRCDRHGPAFALPPRSFPRLRIRGGARHAALYAGRKRSCWRWERMGRTPRSCSTTGVTT